MAIVEVTRRQVLRALRMEPVRTLRAGQWVGGADIGTHAVGATVCTVCAVGAVLRNAVLNTEQLATNLDAAAKRIMNAEREAGALAHLEVAGTGYHTPEVVAQRFAESVEAGAPMAALSYAFESLWQRADGDQRAWYRARNRLSPEELSPRRIEGVRRACIGLVRRYFPKTIVLDINGAAPSTTVSIH